MSNFLEFVNKRKNRDIIIKEKLSTEDFSKYIDNINKLLKKHIDKLVPLSGFVTSTQKNKTYVSKQYVVVDKKVSFQINWDDTTGEFDSINFFKDLGILFNGKSKSVLTINCLDKSSLVYFIPIIFTVVNSGDYNLSQSEAIEIGRSIFKSKNVKESYYYVGALKYKIYENFIFEDDLDKLKKKKKEVDDAFSKSGSSYDATMKYLKLNAEYLDLLKAIKGGKNDVGELSLGVSKNVSVSTKTSEADKKIEQKINAEVEDPELVFKKMSGYIKMIINGMNPSLILCGAPGVGKTFRVRKQLKEAGFEENKNLYTIKGKCTPRRLYNALYEYKDKKNILLIDDADSLVGPKAPEEVINILKAALDSTSDDEGRLVTYGIAGKILDDEGNELPKRFYYNGSVIVITNYNAGQLDTALRGRSYIQDIHFSVDQVLKIIAKLLPEMSKDKLTMQSKTKAYDYLKELADNNEPMEISLRTFNICAVLFQSMEDYDDDVVKSMIKEQMKLQADRGGQKY